MSSRRPKRAVATQAPPTPSRGTRASRVRYEPDEAELDEQLDVGAGGAEDAEGGNSQDDGDDSDNDDVGNSDLTPEPGPSRRSRGGARGRGRARGARNAGPSKRQREQLVSEEDEDQDQPKGRRLRKTVSYKEVPVDEALEAEADAEDEARAEEDAEEDAEGEEEDAEGEEEEGDEDGITPRRRKSKPIDDRERVGSGRGGFSVKGAAAAAARARWAKHRAEKAERGDDSDDGVRKPRRTAARAQQGSSKAAQDTYKKGGKMVIKGVEYTIGDDELEIPDDEKGDTKIDKEGRLLGGREYAPVTFHCVTRANPEQRYALTIDAARACGYSDSLAFLRRCPQVLKIACNVEEQQMLIDIGRVTGNLKHRTITMVSMRNVFKLMGARVVKGGKWVTDDYYEDECLAKAAENGLTPYAPATDEDILANAVANMAPQGRAPAAGGVDRQLAGLGYAPEPIRHSHISLAPFYTLGGPTTTFAGSGEDPWANAGWGNKRMKLKSMGVSNEDWMWRLAKESREIDAQLREYREERLPALEGKDLDVWAWKGWNDDHKEEEAESTEEQGQSQAGTPKIAENGGEGEKDAFGSVVKTDPAQNDASAGGSGLAPPPIDRRRSALSQEVKFAESSSPNGTPELPAGGETAPSSPLTQPSAPSGPSRGAEAGGAMTSAREQAAQVVETTPGGKIVVEDAKMARERKKAYGHGVGKWTAGTVRAIIEPHTHTPHVPRHTQPTAHSYSRPSPYPILIAQADPTRTIFAQSNLRGPQAVGFASVEFCYNDAAVPQPEQYGAYETGGWESGAEWTRDERLRMVKEAEEWERREREKAREAAEIALYE